MSAQEALKSQDLAQVKKGRSVAKGQLTQAVNRIATIFSKKDGDDFGDKETVRTALRGAGDQDTVSLNINKANKMVAGLEYLEAKASLASLAASHR